MANEDSVAYGTEVAADEVHPQPNPLPEGEGAGRADEGVDDASAARVAQLEAALSAVAGQLAEAQGAADVARGEAETQRVAAAEAQALALAAHRRALLAENAGQIVAELVRGGSAADLDASIGVAREAYQRIAHDLMTQAASQVPVGASAATGQTPEELSPIQKITAALSRNGR